MTACTPASPVSVLDGIGPRRAEALARLGVTTVGDLLTLYPRTYENRGDVKPLTRTIPGEKQAVCLTVATEPRVARIRRTMTLLKFRAFDESGSAEITYFNQAYRKEQFTPGETFRFYGKVERTGTRFSLSNPVAEPWREDAPLPALIPVYPLTEGLSGKVLADCVARALALTADASDDCLPADILARNGLCTLSFARKHIHTPADYSSLAAAKKRLIFDEFFRFALGMACTHTAARASGAHPCVNTDLTPLTDRLPFALTGAQARVIEEIRQDMASDNPMCRLVVGDVGSGKTVCAAAAILFALQNGKQAALMAPTEILATQHYQDLAPLFGALGFSCHLLTGAMPAAARRKLLSDLQGPPHAADLVIGTHALLQDTVSFRDLGLVITDEQHRFGVSQRAALAKKSQHVHTLVMSATPIPRSLALTLFGELSLSVVDELPPGRQHVDTFVVDESYRDRLNAFIRRQVEEGGQVYIVCPAVEDKEDTDGDLSLRDVSETGDARETHPPLKAAVAYAEALRSVFPDIPLAFLHGQLKTPEKERIMRDFSEGVLRILVSTTVIEVGVNVPNACVMIVENAERFGLSQLHQLRGRVGRGTRKSYCILVSDSAGARARERLDTLRTTDNGFVLAEKDLAMRGPGDFVRAADALTLRQSGGLRFRLADLCEDADVMQAAFAEARALLDADPTLKGHPALAAQSAAFLAADRQAGTIS